ncbi:MAG: ketopantoate reductase family protein [Candidatus Dormibacteraceae bacterium]
MRFCIVGAGATGGYLGAMLTRAGSDAVLVARGPHLAAMQERGLTIREEGRSWTVRPDCDADLSRAVAGAGCVVVTLKAQSLPAVAPAIGAALRPDATVVFAQNGLPWWYFHGAGGPHDGARLEVVDPGGVIERSIPVSHALGCVVYPATRILEPGVVEHLEDNRFTLGEPSGQRTPRLLEIARALTGAGLRAPVSTRLRSEIWTKLVGNATVNPLAALTRSTLTELVTDRGTREALRRLMTEVEAVASAVGIRLSVSAERRLEGAGKVGAHRPSTLQDLEAGRHLEVGALLGSVVEVARLTGVPVPGLDLVLALLRRLDATIGD